MMPAVLILGGTTEGYELARRLHDLGQWRVVSSLAGRTTNPKAPAGEFRVGGFGGPEGLADYLRSHRIDVLIDATHPFARRMGWNAAAAAAGTATPLLRLERPGWQPGPGDDWVMVEDWPQAAEALRQRQARRVLLTIGRQELASFAALPQTWFLIRSVDAPNPMPPFAQADILLARGPFTLDGELRLLQDHGIDAIVSKNSGGSATDAKLMAARELGIPVVMQDRPARPRTACVADVEQAMAWLAAYKKR